MKHLPNVIYGILQNYWGTLLQYFLKELELE